jgi:hypothetical protein
MEEIKEIKTTIDEEKKLSRSLLKGMSEVLVFGKKPKIKKFNNYSDALNHDIHFFREDLIKVLIDVINELPTEKKVELKNKLLEIEMEEEWDNISHQEEVKFWLKKTENE